MTVPLPPDPRQLTKIREIAEKLGTSLSAILVADREAIRESQVRELEEQRNKRLGFPFQSFTPALSNIDDIHYDNLVLLEEVVQYLPAATIRLLGRDLERRQKAWNTFDVCWSRSRSRGEHHLPIPPESFQRLPGLYSLIQSKLASDLGAKRQESTVMGQGSLYQMHIDVLQIQEQCTQNILHAVQMVQSMVDLALNDHKVGIPPVLKNVWHKFTETEQSVLEKIWERGRGQHGVSVADLYTLIGWESKTATTASNNLRVHLSNIKKKLQKMKLPLPWKRKRKQVQWVDGQR